MGNRQAKLFMVAWRIVLLMAIATLLVLGLYQSPLPSVDAQSATSRRFPTMGFIVDTPTIAIAGATATTSSTSTTGASSALVSFVFGTVTGSYGTCTVQAQTSIDGSGFVNLGTAAAITVATNQVNVWTILAQAPVTTGVTTSTPSSSAIVSFGQISRYVFACSSYGTAAPVTVTALYR